MDKLKEFIEFLNDEELALLEELRKNKAFREHLDKLMPEEAAKEIALNVIIHFYIGQDRAGIITDEQDKRWTEVQNKAYELGIIDFKRFSK